MVKPIPDHLHTVTPRLAVPGGDAIAFSAVGVGGQFVLLVDRVLLDVVGQDLAHALQAGPLGPCRQPERRPVPRS